MLDKLLRYVNALTTGLLIITLTFMTISGYIAMNQILVNQTSIIDRQKTLENEVKYYIPLTNKILDDDQIMFKQLNDIAESHRRMEELLKHRGSDGK